MRTGSMISRTVSMLGLILCVTGCASGPEKFEPPAAADHGPWDVQVHQTVVDFWVSFGPYHTNKMYKSHQKKASEVGIQQVNFESKSDPTAFELMNAYGDPVYVTSGFKPAEKSLKLGIIDIPLSAQDMAGVIACGGRPIAEFERRFEKQDTIGLKPALRIESLRVGEVVLTVQEREPSGGLNLLGDYGLDYIDASGTKVASLGIQPKRRIFISQSLPDDVRNAIAAHAAQLSIAHIQAERQQTANSLGAAARLAAP